ncbi:hypothetical protein NMY22_g4944 [Coprinellus aureogranulatus]|nr:hypothetical protein NMY22_g4944 [Coprinellus aureogranulatus]
MVQSLFTHNTNATQHARKSSAPSPLQQIALQHQSTTSSSAPSSNPAPSPLSLISPPSSTQEQGHTGSDSGSSSESGSPFTPSSVPSHAFMMPSYETLLEPPRESVSGAGAHQDAYGAEGPFGGWDWPVGEGTLDNNWDVNSIPLASLSPSSLSPGSNCMDPTNGMDGMNQGMDGMTHDPASMTSPTQQLTSQFGSLGMGGAGKGIEMGAFDEQAFDGMGGMEYGSDPTLIGVNGYDDILAGGAFA